MGLNYPIIGDSLGLLPLLCFISVVAQNNLKVGLLGFAYLPTTLF